MNHCDVIMWCQPNPKPQVTTKDLLYAFPKYINNHYGRSRLLPICLLEYHRGMHHVLQHSEVFPSSPGVSKQCIAKGYIHSSVFLEEAPHQLHSNIVVC